MKTLISATLVLLCWTDAPAQVAASGNTAAPAASPMQQRYAITAAQPSVSIAQTPKIEVNGFQWSGDAGDRAQDAVLVVGGPDLKPETLATLTEDLTVMCRIFDKALQPRGRSTAATFSSGRRGALNSWFLQQTGRTQGLYVDGYGAVFFVGVDFPLVAPPQQNAPAEAQDAGDRVWSQTVDELRGRPDVDTTDEARPSYDPQKVDTLKATLIKTLRHAANLRMSPQEQITVVAGSQNQGSMVGVQQRLHFLYQQSANRRATLTPSGTYRLDKPAADPAATLVLRVVKSDLEALAAGTLSAEQFAPKVLTFWSWTQPPAPESPANPTKTVAPGAIQR